jgi:hypothetical protein
MEVARESPDTKNRGNSRGTYTARNRQQVTDRTGSQSTDGGTLLQRQARGRVGLTRGNTSYSTSNTWTTGKAGCGLRAKQGPENRHSRL